MGNNALYLPNWAGFIELGCFLLNWAGFKMCFGWKIRIWQPWSQSISRQEAGKFGCGNPSQSVYSLAGTEKTARSPCHGPFLRAFLNFFSLSNVVSDTGEIGLKG